MSNNLPVSAAERVNREESPPLNDGKPLTVWIDFFHRYEVPSKYTIYSVSQTTNVAFLNKAGMTIRDLLLAGF